MKYRLETLIQKPRLEVWNFFTDPQRTKLWQPSLIRIESIHGISGQPGSESIWVYKEKEREFSLEEKVLQREEPACFENTFNNEFARNTVVNRFVEQGTDQTLWILETTFEFKTLPMKILGPVLKKNYVARSQREMERFKEAVEGNTP